MFEECRLPFVAKSTARVTHASVFLLPLCACWFFALQDCVGDHWDACVDRTCPSEFIILCAMLCIYFFKSRLFDDLSFAVRSGVGRGVPRAFLTDRARGALLLSGFFCIQVSMVGPCPRPNG